jgi:CBS domain-containing protein
MQARDVMTREVVTVRPGTSVKCAAEILATRGFAALPVVDGDGRLLGIVTEADVLRDRVLPDPRLRLRRDADTGSAPPPVHVGGVMTTDVRTVEAAADVAEPARLLVDEGLRSVPVIDRGRLVGIVSRRDLVRTLIRSDDDMRADLVRLLMGYNGTLGGWEVTVDDGVATMEGTDVSPEVPAGTDERALRTLARTVRGIVDVRVLPARGVLEPTGEATC